MSCTHQLHSGQPLQNVEIFVLLVDTSNTEVICEVLGAGLPYFLEAGRTAQEEYNKQKPENRLSIIQKCLFSVGKGEIFLCLQFLQFLRSAFELY